MKVNNWKVGEKYWKETHRCFYYVITHPNGRRETRRLDPDSDKAEEKRWDFIKSLKKGGTPSSDYGVRDLCNLFLDHAKLNNRPSTYVTYRHHIKSFCSTIPADLRVCDLKLHHVQNWMNRKYPKTCSPNTRYTAIGAVKRVFNWAVNEMEYLDRNPLARLKKPGQVPRATCLSQSQWSEVLGCYKEGDPFRLFLEFLLQTGCRPQEARIIEAKHIDWEAKEVHLKDGEVPGKKGDRDIILTDRALAILKEAASQYPEGALLRNEDGNPWKKDAVNSRIQRLRKSDKLSFPFHCYLTRHSVATEMLDAGASAGAVAAVLGHKDATMVLKVYGKHIERRKEHLRECLAKATG